MHITSSLGNLLHIEILQLIPQEWHENYTEFNKRGQ